MGMLAFFPWLEIPEEIQVDRFVLIPFRRGKLPGGTGSKLQLTLDAILEPYMVAPDRSVSAATLVMMKGRGLTEELAQEDINELFLFSEIVAFSGLASREYFGSGLYYVNRDHFTFMVQSFKDPFDAICVESRRRDGVTKNLVSRKAFRVYRPFHVSSGVYPVRLDTVLMKALLRARDTQRWSRYEEAIFDFNRANTDSNQIMEQMELVLLNGAFERLFGIEKTSKRERELVKRVVDIICKSGLNVCKTFNGISNEKHKCIFQDWIADLYCLRGNLAHGRKRPTYPSRWSLQEHLLLGSYLFPLVVKLFLRKDGLYELKEDDCIDLQVFEELASARLFDEPKSDQGWPWDEIHEKAKLEKIFHKV